MTRTCQLLTPHPLGPAGHIAGRKQCKSSMHARTARPAKRPLSAKCGRSAQPGCARHGEPRRAQSRPCIPRALGTEQAEHQDRLPTKSRCSRRRALRQVLVLLYQRLRGTHGKQLVERVSSSSGHADESSPVVDHLSRGTRTTLTEPSACAQAAAQLVITCDRCAACAWSPFSDTL